MTFYYSFSSIVLYHHRIFTHNIDIHTWLMYYYIGRLYYIDDLHETTDTIGNLYLQ